MNMKPIWLVVICVGLIAAYIATVRHVQNTAQNVECVQGTGYRDACRDLDWWRRNFEWLEQLETEKEPK